MFHYEILSPWSFLTFWNGLPGIWRQLCIKMWFWHFSTHKICVTVRGKFSKPHFVALFFSNPGEKVWKARKTLSVVFLAFQTFSPGLVKNEETKCGSENFSRTVTYILCVEKCQKHISMHSGLQIPGRPFQNMRKLHGLRISKWNLSIPAKLLVVHLHSWLFSNPCGKVLIIVEISWSPDQRVQHICKCQKYIFNFFLSGTGHWTSDIWHMTRDM